MKSLLMTVENGSKVHNELKTMTRRCRGLGKVNEKPEEWEVFSYYPDGCWMLYNKITKKYETIKSKYQVGDLVAIREPHYLWGVWKATVKGEDDEPKWSFIPDFSKGVYYPDTFPDGEKWATGHCPIPMWNKRPGMFMFDRYVRSHVRITEVICQRLQEITHQDITAEGLGDGYTEIGWNYAFGQLWNSINGKHKKGEPDLSWGANPWVFGYRFLKVEVPHDS